MKIGLFAVVSGRVGGMAVMKASPRTPSASASRPWGARARGAARFLRLTLSLPRRRHPARPTDAPIADRFLTLCTMASVTRKFRLATVSAWCPSITRGTGQSGRDARLALRGPLRPGRRRGFAGGGASRASEFPGSGARIVPASISKRCAGCGVTRSALIGASS